MVGTGTRARLAAQLLDQGLDQPDQALLVRLWRPDLVQPPTQLLDYTLLHEIEAFASIGLAVEAGSDARCLAWNASEVGLCQFFSTLLILVGWRRYYLLAGHNPVRGKDHEAQHPSCPRWRPAPRRQSSQ
jgi:hypothetical protein